MLTAIGLLLLLLVALLAVPVTLRFQLSHRQRFEGYVMLQWAFGLVRVRIPISGIQPKARREKRRKRPPRRSQDKSKPLALIRYRPFRRRVFRLLAGLWRAIRKQDVALQIRLGLGDPADTGRLWALVGPAAGLLANVKEVQVEIEPEFMEAVFALEGHGSVRIVPLQIMALVIAFLLSPPVWRGIRLMRRAG